MIIKEKDAVEEKPFEPFTIELTFQTKEDVSSWFKSLDLDIACVAGIRTDIQRGNAKYNSLINQISTLLIKKGF